MSPADEVLNRARALSAARRHREALDVLQDALPQIEDSAAAWGLMGAQLLALKRAGDAVAALERAAALDARPAFFTDLAAALTRIGRIDDAFAAYAKALAIHPDHLPALNNRASLWLDVQKPDSALADAQRVIALRPDLLPPYRVGCRALLALDRPAEALALIERGRELGPDDPDVRNNRGCALQALQRFDEALDEFEAAVRLQPDEPNHRYNRAFLKLRQYDYESGWRDYEARWRASVSMSSTRSRILNTLPPLDLGVRAEDLAAKNVLVFGEQGVGDEIMFASLIPDLRASAAAVTFITQPRLRRLFADAFPGLPVLIGVKSLDLTAFDKVVPIGSLAGAYRNRREDFPGRPYLSAPAPLTEAWRERLGPTSARLRIGLAWRGGTGRTGASHRSISLEALRPLLERTDCEFVSLQYGDVAAEVEAFNATLVRPIRVFAKDQIDDLQDQAALLQTVDVVVSVQQTLVHLSGALGVPCLVLLPYHMEWRYGRSGETMPWYASVRLLRQPSPGDWASVVGAAGAALDAASPRL